MDWIAKRHVIEQMRSPKSRASTLTHPKVADGPRGLRRQQKRGLYYLLERRGLAERMCDEKDIEQAKFRPPQTTRAKLRGEFIRAAKRKRRDYTVDWVHLKLNDQAQRTVLCKDPFRYSDERVAKLITSL